MSKEWDNRNGRNETGVIAAVMVGGVLIEASSSYKVEMAFRRYSLDPSEVQEKT
jgi:hypothetical protein